MLQLEILAQGWRRRGATQLTQQSIHLQEPPFKAYCTVWMCKQLNSLVSRNNSIPYPSLTPSSKAYYAPLSHLKVKCKNSHKGLTTRWFSHTLSELTFKFPNEWRIILFCRASSHQEKRKARPPICSNHTDSMGNWSNSPHQWWTGDRWNSFTGVSPVIHRFFDQFY